MLVEGVKLMLVGMATVLLFLMVTIFLIQVVSRLARKSAFREMEAIRLERERRGLARKQPVPRGEPRGAADVEDDIAVIAAAVAAYEAERFAGA